MRKLCFLASILPMFGCNHVELNNQNQTVGEKAVLIQEENVKQHSPQIKIKRNNYTMEELQDDVLNVNDRGNAATKQVSSKKKNSAMLNVPLIKQNPELRYGCEVTSLTMVLQYAGVRTSKMDLYRLIKKDPDPLVKVKGNIVRWGNPAHGFVGDMTGRNAGYAVFDQPMVNLINRKLPGRAVNLTNQPFEKVLDHVSQGYPVVVWTTGDYRLPDRWESWYHGKQYIKTPLDLHAVVLVGFDQNHVYLNDPLSGKKQVKVNKRQFIASWEALKKRAVSYK